MACSVFTGTHTVPPSEGLLFYTVPRHVWIVFHRTFLFWVAALEISLHLLHWVQCLCSMLETWTVSESCWQLCLFRNSKKCCLDVCVASTCLFMKKVSEVYKLSKVDHPKWWTFEHYCIISQYWLLLLYAGFISDWIWIPEWSLVLILNIPFFSRLTSEKGIWHGVLREPLILQRSDAQHVQTHNSPHCITTSSHRGQMRSSDPNIHRFSCVTPPAC